MLPHYPIGRPQPLATKAKTTGGVVNEGKGRAVKIKESDNQPQRQGKLRTRHLHRGGECDLLKKREKKGEDEWNKKVKKGGRDNGWGPPQSSQTTT